MSTTTMTSRERVSTIVDRGEASATPDRPGFWMGNPHRDSWPALVREFGSAEAAGRGIPAQLLSVRERLGDDFRWICPEWTSYKHPEGKPIFDIGRHGDALSSPGAFAECESVQEVDDYHWPNPEYLDFTECLTELREAGPVYRASGFWAPFFHITADFFNEPYMVGAHWFIYGDFDTAEREANRGLVRSDGRPWEELVRELGAIHRDIESFVKSASR